MKTLQNDSHQSSPWAPGLFAPYIIMPIAQKSVSANASKRNNNKKLKVLCKLPPHVEIPRRGRSLVPAPNTFLKTSSKRVMAGVVARCIPKVPASNGLASGKRQLTIAVPCRWFIDKQTTNQILDQAKVHAGRIQFRTLCQP